MPELILISYNCYIKTHFKFVCVFFLQHVSSGGFFQTTNTISKYPYIEGNFHQIPVYVEVYITELKMPKKILLKLVITWFSNGSFDRKKIFFCNLMILILSYSNMIVFSLVLLVTSFLGCFWKADVLAGEVFFLCIISVNWADFLLSILQKYLIGMPKSTA